MASQFEHSPDGCQSRRLRWRFNSIPQIALQVSQFDNDQGNWKIQLSRLTKSAALKWTYRCSIRSSLCR